MKSKAVQVYGYVVCVVCVITLLICLGGLITAIIDLGDPFHSSYQYKESLSSFENYKVEAMKSITQDAAYIPDDTALREMYDAAKEEIIARKVHMDRRNIIVNSIIIVIACVLFFIHWKYLVKRTMRSYEL